MAHISKKCECEHVHHGDTPCPRQAEVPVKTAYGTFRVCGICLSQGHVLMSGVSREDWDD